MRIGIMGAGAVGGYFGARLAQGGEDVVFIARGPHLNAMRNKGLMIEGPTGSFVVYPVNATEAPSEVGGVDAVFMGVKAWQVMDAAQAIRPMIGPSTVVVPLQNGVEAPTQLAAALGAPHVVGGSCRIVSHLDGPGRIRHRGVEPHVVLGELDNRPSRRVGQLRDVFLRAGVSAEIPADIHRRMWQKFLMVASLSGVGAVMRLTIGEWRRMPKARRMLEELMLEVVAVAVARGIELSRKDVDRNLAFVDTMPADGTTSMQRDIMNGVPSELEYLSGAMVRFGQESDVPTPRNEFVYHRLLPQVK